ncbi:hypothetical protein Slin15195_G096130 [Septoria linicola]|uniref:Uncharacterized protein n=1 Tax=Septoria linicola TaxID=215465 RepID=A0A9Q9EN82_9PEZI|nr:hypothetical protein Slin14017_G059220 [Septoria linicola]USW56294.1 hypothetical protein Slin15195_G096130 [Septoria linicola]
MQKYYEKIRNQKELVVAAAKIKDGAGKAFSLSNILAPAYRQQASVFYDRMEREARERYEGFMPGSFTQGGQAPDAPRKYGRLSQGEQERSWDSHFTIIIYDLLRPLHSRVCLTTLLEDRDRKRFLKTAVRNHIINGYRKDILARIGTHLAKTKQYPTTTGLRGQALSKSIIASKSADEYHKILALDKWFPALDLGFALLTQVFLGQYTNTLNSAIERLKTPMRPYTLNDSLFRPNDSGKSAGTVQLDVEEKAKAARKSVKESNVDPLVAAFTGVGRADRVDNGDGSTWKPDSDKQKVLPSIAQQRWSSRGGKTVEVDETDEAEHIIAEWLRGNHDYGCISTSSRPPPPASSVAKPSASASTAASPAAAKVRSPSGPPLSASAAIFMSSAKASTAPACPRSASATKFLASAKTPASSTAAKLQALPDIPLSASSAAMSLAPAITASSPSAVQTPMAMSAQPSAASASPSALGDDLTKLDRAEVVTRIHNMKPHERIVAYKLFPIEVQA